MLFPILQCPYFMDYFTIFCVWFLSGKTCLFETYPIFSQGWNFFLLDCRLFQSFRGNGDLLPSKLSGRFDFSTAVVIFYS